MIRAPVREKTELIDHKLQWPLDVLEDRMVNYQVEGPLRKSAGLKRFALDFQTTSAGCSCGTLARLHSDHVRSLVSELLQERAVAAADFENAHILNVPVRRRLLDEGRQIGDGASHAHGAERCAHLRAHTICLSERTRNLLVRTLYDQAGVLIHPHDEGKSIRQRGILGEARWPI